jgi:hypothetical protein
MMFRVEVRNNATYGAFEKRDILDIVSNTAAGYDLFGH